MNPGALKIRPVEGFDLPVLAALHAACFSAPWDQPWSERSFADVLQMPGAGARIAALGSEPVGFAVARVAADEAELLLIGVHPGHRRAGHGRVLLGHLVEALRAAGAARLFLEVAAGNEAATAFYRAAGFEPVGRRANYYAGQDALVLMKALPAVIA
ncbi:GNAT family N-acetyltransferase [Dongia sp.]|uniref:GNAT family N-acetyltransferase n=1 Tax=Dongia sp. TaxID=1977262 RepID=UPI00375133A4